MQRGGGVEELLAISPPPEFQDLPAPPPPVFRDLSPFPRGIAAGGSTTAAAGNRKSESQPLWDFADRISFDILNEAMVIATEEVLSYHGGCNRSVTAPAYDQPFSTADSSDTDEENPVSTTTSWEYLSKASSWSDVQCVRSPASPEHSRLHTSPRHQNQRTSRNKKPDSSSRLFTASSSNQNPPVSFLHNEKPWSTQTHQWAVMRSASFHMDTLVPNLNLLPNSKHNNEDLTMEGPSRKSRNRSADDSSACYNLPFQSDIYSLPIDNLVSHSEDHNEPTNAPKRSRCRATNLSTAPPQENLPSSSCKHEQAFINHNNATQKNVGKSSIVSSTSTCGHSQTSSQALLLSSGEKNNNNFDSGGQQEDDVLTRSFRPPRSRSVEMSNSGNSRQNNSSHNSNYPIENTPLTLAEQHCPGKPEKRTLGHSILNLFKRNKPRGVKSETSPATTSFADETHSRESKECAASGTNTYRALPLPPESHQVSISEEAVSGSQVDHPPPAAEARDFALSIEKVKDCGWYWGPLSSEAAEDLLRGEPDGSFIVRDSSDAHYIFSLTFKLNGLVRHVRIEHDQGNFSFGPLTRFKASTIVDFVEKAVAHSRSGRYLFFLHRRPVLGPMRVQLLHPYSRFRHPRSLQHMCRFVILKYVRRDLIHTLPLPKPLQDYLNTPHYYFEQQHDQKKNTS